MDGGLWISHVGCANSDDVDGFRHGLPAIFQAVPVPRSLYLKVAANAKSSRKIIEINRYTAQLSLATSHSGIALCGRYTTL